ncbi:MAG: hypothetical protein ACP5U0_06950, partial [Caldisphaera sp.]
HNCNVGIKKAMEYNPKWIVVSNDDMYKIDESSKLINELKKIDENKCDVCFPIPGNYYYHTVNLYIGEILFTYKLLRYISKHYIGKLYKKFGIIYHYALPDLRTKLVFKKVPETEFEAMNDFGIFSIGYVERNGGILFDETYINEHEDIDLSFRLKINNAMKCLVDYKIGAIGGATYPWSRIRVLRQPLSMAYFNYKYENLFKEFQQSYGNAV